MLTDSQLENRLNILLSTGTITQNANATVRHIIEKLEKNWNIQLTEENGSRLITHLAMALTRSEKGEGVAKMENDALEEFQSLDSFSKAEEISKDLVSDIKIAFPQNELEFLIINVCLILEE